jgi:hypothetical protein
MKNVAIIACAALAIGMAYLVFANIMLGNELDDTRLELELTAAELISANAQVEALEAELSETEEELDYTYICLQNTGRELNETRGELNRTREELEQTEEDLRQTASMLDEAIAEFEELSGELDSLDESIGSSIQWFRDNSVLPRTYNNFFWKAGKECTSKSDVLNLGCVVFLMEEELHFSYKHEYPDRLYSLNEMVGNHGGDCEDYSLMVKAILNRFRDAGSNPELEAWEEGEGRYIIYEEEDVAWYMNGEAKPLGELSALNPYVICFVTHSSGTDFQGHCIVALSEGSVGGIGDIGNLQGASAFEPQTGEWKGDVGEEFYLCREGEIACGMAPGEIVFIITDDDLYQFQEGEWKGYELYAGQVEDLGRRIRKIIG